MTEPMPVIHIDRIRFKNDHERDIVAGIMNGNRLRATKPRIRREYVGTDTWNGEEWKDNSDDLEKVYIWRFIAFYSSPRPEHLGIPISALKLRYLDKKLGDDFIERILEGVDKIQKAGIERRYNVLSGKESYRRRK